MPAPTLTPTRSASSVPPRSASAPIHQTRQLVAESRVLVAASRALLQGAWRDVGAMRRVLRSATPGAG